MERVTIYRNSVRKDSKLPELFKQFGVGRCWQVLQELAEASTSVGDLAQRLGRAESEISRSLKHLRNLGLVNCHTVKKLHFYTLSEKMRCVLCSGFVELHIDWKEATGLVVRLDRPPLFSPTDRAPRSLQHCNDLD